MLSCEIVCARNLLVKKNSFENNHGLTQLLKFIFMHVKL